VTASAVRVLPLGGLGEIGKNMTVVECDGRIVVIDVGLRFPSADMLGIDLVLPDFTYLREQADRFEGCLLTHGHEDHVGALSFLLRDLSFPIFGSPLTLGLARNRIEEAGLLDRIERAITLAGRLDHEQRARLLEIADKCPVHRTLTSEIEIRTTERRD